MRALFPIIVIADFLFNVYVWISVLAGSYSGATVSLSYAAVVVALILLLFSLFTLVSFRNSTPIYGVLFTYISILFIILAICDQTGFDSFLFSNIGSMTVYDLIYKSQLIIIPLIIILLSMIRSQGREKIDSGPHIIR